MPLRRLITLCVLSGLLIFGLLSWSHISPKQQTQETPAVAIHKLPVAFASHTFDPSSPAAEVPSLAPGETAVCDSDFLSSATVRGDSRKTAATQAALTVTQVKMTLQLRLNIWVPTGANQHVIEHEDGHRQISEYYYQTADKLAERIATTYIGRKFDITGNDLDAASSKMLQQLASEITAEYDKQLNPGPTQLLYDSITDHARNAIDAKAAVDHAIKNVAIESPDPTTSTSN